MSVKFDSGYHFCFIIQSLSKSATFQLLVLLFTAWATSAPLERRVQHLFHIAILKQTKKRSAGNSNYCYKKTLPVLSFYVFCRFSTPFLCHVFFLVYLPTYLNCHLFLKKKHIVEVWTSSLWHVLAHCCFPSLLKCKMGLL